MLVPSCSAENSTPGTSSIPASVAASLASGIPAMLSWSVSARTSSPRSFASSTSVRGDSVPSEYDECVCRSMPGICLRERVLAREGAADDELLDLAGPLVQRGHAGVPQVLPHRVLVDVAVAAVHLDRGVRGPDRHF